MDRISVGIVARAHGVRGELRVHLHDAGSTTLYDVRKVFVGDAEHVVDSVRPTSGALLVKLVGVDDRDAAEALRGRPVTVRRADLPLGEHEFLVADLVGCDVTDAATGAPLGQVHTIWHGPQDILVIHDATHERLVPLVPELLAEVDIPGRRVVVALPEGLPAEPLTRAPGKEKRR
jgi:16S rRNA processing protein RimM